MELELGLKITRTRDDLTSSTDFRIAKNPSGVLFWSKETESMFILIIHLRGFRKENIEIEINRDGNQIVISGKKPVQEMVLINWIMRKKEVELRAFRKVFRIPCMVNLDRIKAKFNEEESTMNITMPKKVKGISGLKIEEESNEEELQDTGEVEIESKTGEIQRISVDPKLENMEETSLTSEESANDLKKEETSREEICERVNESTEENDPMEKIEEPSVEFPETEEEELVAEKFEEKKIEEETEQEVEEGTEIQQIGENKDFATDKDESEPELNLSTELENSTVELVEVPDPIITTEAIEMPEPTPLSFEETEREEPPAANKKSETEEVAEAEETFTNDETEEEAQEIPDLTIKFKGEEDKQTNPDGNKAPTRKSKRPRLCDPLLVAGSALLVSLIVILIHLIRSKKR
ncbi:probable serine/threonine-protein kinase kinX [Carica papaya]|uniref:probable serine/threonine-protein kinase kinX n=1 Tax=Carica papaya TaxID=3649 RepID=UPI000B8CFB5C|nr:probable serine/threonine-protein kinase kinX [Carica papaya]